MALSAVKDPLLLDILLLSALTIALPVSPAASTVWAEELLALTHPG